MGHSVGELMDKTHYERPIIVMTSSENAQYIYSSVSHVLHSFIFIFLQVSIPLLFQKASNEDPCRNVKGRLSVLQVEAMI